MVRRVRIARPPSANHPLTFTVYSEFTLGPFRLVAKDEELFDAVLKALSASPTGRCLVMVGKPPEGPLMEWKGEGE